MKKTKDKTLSNKTKIIIFTSILVVAIIAIILYILTTNTSKNLNLTEFEKIAVYGYLEDYLALDKLYLLSGKSSYDDLHYTQSKIKNILDSHYNSTREETISITTINSELDSQYGISSDNIDYHGIIVSDYTYLPEEKAFKRVEGANSNMASSEIEVNNISNGTHKLSITNIERVSNESYIAYFDIVDSSNENTIYETGNVTIKINNNTYELESCSID